MTLCRSALHKAIYLNGGFGGRIALDCSKACFNVLCAVYRNAGFHKTTLYDAFIELQFR